MTIPLTGTGGLFTRLGKIGLLLNDLNSFRGTGTLGPDVDGIFAQFNSAPDQSIVDSLYSTRNSYRGIHSQLTNYIKSLASSVVQTMANDDTALVAVNLQNAMTLLISQMKTAAASVQASTPAVSVTAGSSNTGTGLLLASIVGPDGKNMEYVIPETLTATITSDNQVGATAGSEPANVKGVAPETDTMQWDWPLGSGASANLTAVDANLSNGLNVLTNSSFETFTSNAPNNWTIATGTAGTTILAGGSGQAYKNQNCLEIAGNGSELTKLYQSFNNSTSGTAAKLKPSTVYAINLWLKMSVVPAAGVLKISLTDGNGNVVNDANGTANTFSVALTGATTGYVAHNAFFRTPAVLPTTGLRLQIELTTAITTGDNLFIDTMAMTPATQVYTGGPFAALFSGDTNFITNDTWSLAATNTYGVFQKFFDRTFGMRALGLQLPSSGTPTISDSLL